MFPFNAEMDSIEFIFPGVLSDNDSSGSRCGGRAVPRRRQQVLNTGSRPRPGVNGSLPAPLPTFCFHPRRVARGRKKPVAVRQCVGAEQEAVGGPPGLEKRSFVRCC